ncbi:MAG TPA: hypothetical protein VK203_20660 [Nostocaceae cyanobacterium]|nr:hypothetical protein [Nostocaceae cyanobacterium]
MIRRSLLATALVLAGGAFMAEGAFAQSVDVNFSGTVQGRCSFGNVTNGILVTDSPGTPQGAYKLNSFLPGASAGQVTVNCNQPASLQVSAPIQTAGPTGNRVGASVSSPYGAVNTGDPVFIPGSSSGPNPLYLNPGSTPLSVNLAVEPSFNNSYIQPGNYAYKVTLTVAP